MKSVFVLILSILATQTVFAEYRPFRDYQNVPPMPHAVYFEPHSITSKYPDDPYIFWVEIRKQSYDPNSTPQSIRDDKSIDYMLRLYLCPTKDMSPKDCTEYGQISLSDLKNLSDKYGVVNRALQNARNRISGTAKNILTSDVVTDLPIPTFAKILGEMMREQSAEYESGDWGGLGQPWGP